MRKLEEKVKGESPGQDIPKELTFPDFTNFLYNKFLINGAPPAVEHELSNTILQPN